MKWWALLGGAAAVTVNTCTQSAVEYGLTQTQAGAVLIGCSGIIAVSSPIIVPEGATLMSAPGRKVTFSGGNTSAIFSLAGAATFSGFTLKDGFSAGDGGCLITPDIPPYHVNLTLENLTFVNCQALTGGGLYLTSSFTANLTSVIFRECQALDRGGAIHAAGTIIDATDCTFAFNRAGTGGGGVMVEGVTATWRKSRWESNQAGAGGAFFTTQSAVEIDNGVFLENSATQQGGAFYSDQSGVTLVDTWFFNSTAASRGGAVWSCGQCGGEPFVLVGGAICDSVLTQSDGSWVGTGVHVECGNVAVDKTAFAGNVPGLEFAAITPSVTLYYTNVLLGDELARDACDEAFNVTYVNPPTPPPPPAVISAAATHLSIVSAFVMFCSVLISRLL